MPGFGNLRDRPTLQKVLAGLLTSLVALVGIFIWGGDETKDRDVVDRLCRAGLEQIAVAGGSDLCTHGPDPATAFITHGRAPSLSPTSVNRYYRQSLLCPGNGRSGQRVYVHVGAPQGTTVPTSFIASVKQALGYAERQLRESHPTHAQKINYYCATDSTPTIEKQTYPAIGSDGRFTFEDMLATVGDETRPGTHVSFIYGINGAYPYCGEGTVGGFGDDDIHFSLIAPFCTVPPSDTLLHELGHNLGAVAPAAPNDSGAWHCHETSDLMCYQDGGSYFAGGGQMTRICDTISWKGHSLARMDCRHDDYWNPAGSFSWRNAADSPLLTRPRRK